MALCWLYMALEIRRKLYVISQKRSRREGGLCGRRCCLAMGVL